MSWRSLCCVKFNFCEKKRKTFRECKVCDAFLTCYSISIIETNNFFLFASLKRIKNPSLLFPARPKNHSSSGPISIRVIKKTFLSTFLSIQRASVRQLICDLISHSLTHSSRWKKTPPPPINIRCSFPPHPPFFKWWKLMTIERFYHHV